MLLYISNHTCPNITFSVSQVDWFTYNPKEGHATAIKTIVWYLARTFDKGLFFKPDGTYQLKCWVDADFVGLFGRSPSENPTAAKSRYGYVITFGGIPLVWKSQLISEICLSTLCAEYVGLSNCLCALIPMHSLVINELDFLKLPSSNKPEMHCTVFEDNQGAYLRATNQKLSVQTKTFLLSITSFDVMSIMRRRIQMDGLLSTSVPLNSWMLTIWLRVFHIQYLRKTIVTFKAGNFLTHLFLLSCKCHFICLHINWWLNCLLNLLYPDSLF